MGPRFFTILTSTVIRLRWPLLALVAIVTVLFARELSGLQLDNSNEQWLIEGDESLARSEKFKDRFDVFLNEHPLTTRTSSVLDILRQMRRAFNENRPEFYGMPETQAEASQYLLVYEMSGGEDKARLLPASNDIARLTVRTRSLGTRDVGRLFDDIEAYVSDHFDETVRVETTGVMGWARALTRLVALGQQQSFLAALISISIVMMLVLRSVRLGVISMIPNVFPVILTLGLMGLSGRPLDLMVMGFGALIIGVAVDDTIHFFVRYRREFERLGCYETALEATLVSVGRPITFTTLTLSLGFVVLAASDMNGLVAMGVLSSFAFIWALLADFLLAPAILLRFHPLGPERPAAAV